MADRTYQMPEHPEYRTDIRRLDRQDPADAEAIFNPLIQAMLENTHFVRLLAEEIIRQNSAEHQAFQASLDALGDPEADHAALRQEMARTIQDAIDGIPTPDVSGQIEAHNGSSTAHAEQLAAKADLADLTAHTDNTSNPHAVTAAQVKALPISGGKLTGALEIGRGAQVVFLGKDDYPQRPTKAMPMGPTNKWTSFSEGENSSQTMQNTSSHDIGISIPGIILDGVFLGNRQPLQYIGAPTNDNDAATKKYVDSRTASDVGAVPVDSDGNATVSGNLRVQKGNHGTVINLGDGDYVHISEPTEDCLEIKAKRVNFVVSDASDNGFTMQVGSGTKKPIGKSSQELVLMSSVPASLASGQIALVYV